MVSVWPSVDKKSENFGPMMDRGLLIQTERGAVQTYDYQGDCMEIDALNPETRKYVWEVCKKNYYDLGVDGFWLDNSEPDFAVYDHENYRYFAGPALTCSNIYPQMYSRVFFDPMKKMGNDAVVNLLRCAWAGSQKYGNVVWSGDVPSTFEAFYDQLQAGLNMGLAGIPWWTTDIGGFMTDDWEDPDFKQLLIRWYQFAVYSPVLRMHGERGPINIPQLDDRDWGGGYLHTGHSNELWSYGEENYRIMKHYYEVRMAMKEYIKGLFEEASENGSPLLRAMFYEFPEDPKCWELQDQYMFGDRYLVAPVFHLNQWQREVYLPEGTWRDTSDGKNYEGGIRKGGLKLHRRKKSGKNTPHKEILKGDQIMWGILIALLSGALMSIQGVFNTEVTRQSSIWVSAGWVQLTAFVTCLVMWLLTGRPEVQGIWQVRPWYMLSGGVIGALITWTVIRSVESLGPARSALLIVVAQIAVAYGIEVFGLFGVEKSGWEWKKAIGALTAVIGIIIFQK